MYSLSQLRTVLKHPRWLVREPARLLAHSFGKERYYADGFSIFDEDWDTLIVLDACRYDAFADVNTLSGTLENRTSRGATTTEFVRGNFKERELLDTIYVDANGHFGDMQNELETTLFLYRPFYDQRDAAGGRTTTPETVTDVALELHKRHPDKRLIVHYLQPHQPFISPETTGIEHCANLPTTIKRNDLDADDLHELHRQNLIYALESVARLLNEVDGLSVVTADHGEMMFERLPYVPIREFGHNAGLYVPELLTVPWLKVDGPRREIFEADEAIDVNVDSQKARENLRRLGYIK
jgi:hypothetical protein